MIEIKKYSKYEGPGEYIGKFNNHHKLKASPLKNPFNGPINHKSKLRLVKKYKKLLESLPKDSPQWKEIRRLQDLYENKRELTLICWYDPLPCHEKIIKSAILGNIHPKNENYE